MINRKKKPINSMNSVLFLWNAQVFRLFHKKVFYFERSSKSGNTEKWMEKIEFFNGILN